MQVTRVDRPVVIAVLTTLVVWCHWTGYQEKIPFVKSAPIEADEASKAKKKQSAGGTGGKKGTKANASEHPGGDIPTAIADGINNVTLQS